MVAFANDQDVPVISTLRADLVPQREMAIRKWYSGTSNWYYHRRALPGEFDCSRRFYQLIDPQLRSICRLLHRHGIYTTPSCQGHFHDRAYFQRVWSVLEFEEQLIRTIGLNVRHSGDGRVLRFRACTYELPWSNFEEFYSAASVQQTQGYLGIILPRDRYAIVSGLHNHPYHADRAAIRFDGELSCLMGASVFGIAAQPRDPGDGEHLWQSIGNHLRDVLKRSSVVRSSATTQSRARRFNGLSAQG